MRRLIMSPLIYIYAVCKNLLLSHIAAERVNSTEPKTPGELLWPVTVVVRPSVRQFTISLNGISFLTTEWVRTKLYRNDLWVVSSNNTKPYRTWVVMATKRVKLPKQILKIFLSEARRPRSFKFGSNIVVGDIYQYYSNYSPGVKNCPASGITCFTDIHREKPQNLLV